MGWQFAPAAAAPSYDIVYVRVPRHGDLQSSRMADVFRPVWFEPGSDLVLLHPDGTEEVLVAAGPKGAVADPCVSFDAQWVYYALFPDVVTLTQVQSGQQVPVKGSDIYKINIRTKQVVRLTQQEYTPNTAVRTSALPYGIYNMAPCPVSGGRVVFTSNRNGLIPTKGYTPITSQLYVMDEDGTNVHAIAPMTLGSAMHPFQLKDGRIAFSSYESQGLRDVRIWALWAIWPDGRMWEPLWSGFNSAEQVLHFASQLTDERIVVESYYNLNNNGFGQFFAFPAKSPAAPVAFGSPNPAMNVPIPTTLTVYGLTGSRYSFTPLGATSPTPFANPIDEAAAVGPDGKRMGKVTMPSGGPNNDLLMVWSPGPANSLMRPVNTPTYDAGIYIARNGYAALPSNLVLVKNDPNFNEMWPRAVVPYKAMYGVDQPREFPFLPNDGTAHPSLPPGTPYGIIGTSSLYKRDSFPGKSTPNYTYDGLEPFNAFLDSHNSNWIWQGADAGKYTNSEIAAIRILSMEPTSEGQRNWFNHANERLRVLGEIPVRKNNADGTPLLDPEGNPDTSFWARVPADTPFTFQMIDGAGRTLAMSQTWHQVRPGEVRVDCGGCHAHSQKPLDFASTAAAKLNPTDLTLQPAHDVEFVRDVRPILQRKCVSCHQGASPPAGLAFDNQSNVAGVYPDTGSLPKDYAVLARNASAGHGGYKAVQAWYGFYNGSRYLRKFQSRRSLLVWKLAGARLDGWKNADWPTERVPGDKATLPQGSSVHLADLDYTDTANHASLLTAAEQRLIATWIDIGAPIDLGGGHWKDETRPALAVTVSNGAVILGAADAYSGLDAASLSVAINGSSRTLSSLGGGRWTTPLPSGATTLTAKVKDKAGNWTQQSLKLNRTAPAPPSTQLTPGPASNVRMSTN